MIAWSYGGGIQSVAIGVMVAKGVLPKPDLAVIADTGRERRTTWEYLRDHMQPLLGTVGVTVHVAPHTLATKDLYGTDGGTLVPAYDGAEGRLKTYCSGEWKREVVNRWLRSQGVESCDCWIGFSIDEVSRVNKKDRRQWCRHQYPLIDKMINRAMCVGIIKAAGLPVPSKSRCYICPHQNEQEWAEVRDDPDDWARAVAVDEDIRASDPAGAGLFLYSGRVPLKLATFGADGGMVRPAKPCESGHCWT